MPDWMLQLAGYLIVGGMSYGALRADLKGLHTRLEDIKRSASRAHERIDSHIERHHVRAGQ